MRYLMREASLLSEGQWGRIDQAVVAEAKKVLVGRRFVSLVGPLGAQTQNVPLDVLTQPTPASADFWADKETDALKIASRRSIDLTTLYSDFAISWRDIENENGAGVQAAVEAALVVAGREDEILFNGDKSLGVEGIFTAKGVNKISISDWSTGENPIMDLAKALEVLLDKQNTGERALIMSSDLFGKLHRIQPGTGMMEIDRVRSLVAGPVLTSPRLDKNRAALVYSAPHNLDLVIGQDMITAYLGNSGLDHGFRVMETLTPRIKRPQAIAILS